MHRRFHDRFGTAGVVIAIVALIVALGGTALAKGLFTKAQEKKIIAIAKKYAGQQGPAGPAGTNGEKGAKGDQGEKGEKGDTGPAGPITGNLPSKVTQRGVWQLTKTYAPGFPTDSFSWLSLPAAPKPHVIHEGGISAENSWHLTEGSKTIQIGFGGGEFEIGEPVTGTGIPPGTKVVKCELGGGQPECGEGTFKIELSNAATVTGLETLTFGVPSACDNGETEGTAAVPQAAPGNVCIFVTEEEENEEHEKASPPHAMVTTPYGMAVRLTCFCSPAGLSSYGTWAVTAP